jgi:hypothetical protein
LLKQSTVYSQHFLTTNARILTFQLISEQKIQNQNEAMSEKFKAKFSAGLGKEHDCFITRPISLEFRS